MEKNSLNDLKLMIRRLVTSHLETQEKKFIFLQKFLEYFALYKHRLFCTLSHPEDASKINAKHVGFF